MDVIIVCHTEFGRVYNKKVVAVKDPLGVTGGVVNLNKIAQTYKAKVTYAVCPEVVSYFPKSVNGEIGLHIHPGWETFNVDGVSFYVGDLLLRRECKQSSDSTVLWDYDILEQLGMVTIGRDYVKQVLGVVPRVFVAGRWSINDGTTRVLVELGFTHDCSAMPHLRKPHYDWSKLPRICMPYHPSATDYQGKGDYPMLVVPISQMIKGGCVNPEMARVYSLTWLKLAFLEYWFRGVPLFHICLHSPSMTDEYYLGVMDRLLAFISKRENVRFKFASEVKEYVEG